MPPHHRGRVKVPCVCEGHLMLARESTCGHRSLPRWVDHPNKMEYQQLEAKIEYVSWTWKIRTELLYAGKEPAC
jgi:hypothetical protein